MLIGWVAAVIGIIMVVFSLNRIIREVRKAGVPNLEDQSFADTFYQVTARTEQLGEDLDDINQTFYETVDRLEKRIEALEKQLGRRQPEERPKWEAAVRAPAPPPPAPEPATPPAEKPVRPSMERSSSEEDAALAAEIRRLMGEGKDTQQIARELNRGIGEIELIKRIKK